MEVRSRKRAEASSSANPTTARAFKRPRSSTTSSGTPVESRIRHASSAIMNFEHAYGRRRRFGRKSERDRDPPSGKGKERELPEGSSRTREMERVAERILGLSLDNVVQMMTTTVKATSVSSPELDVGKQWPSRTTEEIGCGIGRPSSFLSLFGFLLPPEQPIDENPLQIES